MTILSRLCFKLEIKRIIRQCYSAFYLNWWVAVISTLCMWILRHFFQMASNNHNGVTIYAFWWLALFQSLSQQLCCMIRMVSQVPRLHCVPQPNISDGLSWIDLWLTADWRFLTTYLTHSKVKSEMRHTYHWRCCSRWRLFCWWIRWEKGGEYGQYGDEG